MIPVFIIPVVFMAIFYGVCAIKITKQMGKTCILFKEYGRFSFNNNNNNCMYICMQLAFHELISTK